MRHILAAATIGATDSVRRLVWLTRFARGGMDVWYWLVLSESFFACFAGWTSPFDAFCCWQGWSFSVQVVPLHSAVDFHVGPPTLPVWMNATTDQDGVSDYLDTYFRLLRADCFAPLQKGIRDFLNGSLDPRDMRLFRASAQQFHLVRGSKGLVASMECSNIFNYAVPFPARVLMPSNLVCLSISEAPFAEVLWGRVAERPSDRAAQKKETMVAGSGCLRRVHYLIYLRGLQFMCRIIILRWCAHTWNTVECVLNRIDRSLHA